MIEQIETQAQCGGCQSFAHGFAGSNWNCRRGRRRVNADTPACEQWRELANDIEEVREALDQISPLMLEPPIDMPVKPDLQPPGLRGHIGGVVYFVDCGEFTKIGHTVCPIAARLKNIETHNPFELLLWALLAGGRDLEARLHQEFADHRHRNEWFRFNEGARERAFQFVRSQGGEVYG